MSQIENCNFSEYVDSDLVNMSSSETESENQTTSLSRLGDCEVCGSKHAIYTCPKCEVKTCCLSCVRIHKKELECDGIRDRTKFIRMKDFSDTDLLSDYRLLEECSRFVYGIKRDKKKKFTRIEKDLPIHLFKLKMAARHRGIVLQFLAQNFTRHINNSSRYNFKTHIINWRIEWIFPNVDSTPIKFVDTQCSEHKRLSELLDKYLNLESPPFEQSKSLAYYRSVGFSGIKILLKAEKVKGSSHKYFELDPTESLMENLSGKCIVEFPIIFVVLKDHAYNFEIITPEDEFNYTQTETNDDNDQTKKSELNTNQSYSNNVKDNISENSVHKHPRRPKQLLTQKIAEAKKLEIEKEIKEEKKKRPKNLLFTTGYSSEESFSDGSSDDNKV
ncbi:hypothetical protein ACJJTC_006142 [Scirpophaga incertulas]